MSSGPRTLLVVGGTGMTGQAVVALAVESGRPVVATSRAVDGNGLPAGPLALASTVVAVNGVKWVPFSLEAKGDSIQAELQNLESALKGVAFDVVVAAAYTNVDGCETDPEFCERVNVTNTKAVLSWAVERGARVLFYSTDYVFNGESGPYTEDEAYSPTCVYGRAKVDLEKWLLAYDKRALILRTTGVYDYILGSKNFLMQVIDAARDNREMRVPLDQKANPVWGKELAKASLELLEGGLSGVFHVAGGTQIPRPAFAELIRSELGLTGGKITPITTASLGQKAKRPLDGGLLCGKLKSALGWAPRTPQVILQELKNGIHRS